MDALRAQLQHAPSAAAPMASPVDGPLDTPESILHGADARVPAAFLEVGRARVPLLARLWSPWDSEGPVRDGASGGFGTAWLLTPALLLTCHHVLSSRRPLAPDALARCARGVRLHFGATPPPSLATDPDVVGTTLVAADPELDFVILRLDRARSGAFPCHRARFRLGARPFQAATIPQYPRGGALSLGLRKNRILRADTRSVQYETDTEPGSSGAPVCDDDWVAFALHQAAGNRGVQLGAVFDALERAEPAVYAEIERTGDVRR